MWALIETRERSSLLQLSPERPTTLGRALDCTILIEDDAASREHARIERDEAGGWQLRDLESRNGTRLNGSFVRHAPLAPGDRVEIGATALLLLSEEEARARQEGERAQRPAQPDEEELEISRDPLTGLDSYAVVQCKLAHGLSKAPEGVAVVKLDLDYLGLLNDLFGLRAGDEVIRQVGFALQEAAEAAPEAVLSGREAGGKFVLVIPGDAARGRALAEDARARVSARRLGGVLGQATLTLSAGVARAEPGERGWQELLRRAEAALGQAKALGRDRCEVAGAGAGAGRAAAPEAALQRAIRQTRAAGVWGPAAASERPPVPSGELQPLAVSGQGQALLGLVAEALGADLELDSLLELILSVLVDAVGARRGFLLLRAEPQGPLRLRAAVDRDSPGSQRESAVSQGVIQAAEAERAPVLIEDARSDARFGLRESLQREGARSVLAAPVLWREAVVGVLYLDDKSRPGAFGAAQRDLVLATCGLLGGPIRRHSRHLARARELERTQRALSRGAEQERERALRYRSLLGRSEPMQRLRELLDRLRSSAHPVLIHGESGTGKELVARAIHYNSPRAEGPFVAESCAVFSETLLEAELFGHVAGAFTGAEEERVGLFEAADGGTLFLDEIGETSPAMQAKLLRVLQEGELRPLGSPDTRRVDVRLLCASHRDLRAMVAAGSFREDLYYRIAVMTVEVPPLRERRADVPLLLDHFLAEGARAAGRLAPSLGREALAFLTCYPWPGNVRELRNECDRLLTLVDGEVTPADLSPRLRGEEGQPGAELQELAAREGAAALGLLIEQGLPLSEAAEAIEIELVRQVLAACHGNRSEAARRLGVSRPGLQGKLKRYGIQ